MDSTKDPWAIKTVEATPCFRGEYEQCKNGETLTASMRLTQGKWNHSIVQSGFSQATIAPYDICLQKQ